MISDKDGGDSDYNDGDEIDMLDSSLKQPTTDNNQGAITLQGTPNNKSDAPKNIMRETPKTLCQNSK